MNVWDFADKNPWFTFFLGFWALMIIAFVAVAFRTIFTALNIWVRGWPPPHLDAQGEFKKEPEKKKEEKKEEPTDTRAVGSMPHGAPYAGHNKEKLPPGMLR